MFANGVATRRSLELRLIRCTIPSEYPSPPTPPLTRHSSPVSHIHHLLNVVVCLIESGHYLQALSSCETIFTDVKLDSSIFAHRFYTETLPECAGSYLTNNCDDCEEIGYRALLLMAVGVSAFLAFTQQNITGPRDKLPILPIVELCTRKVEIGAGDRMQWEEWAHTELMSVGSDLCGNLSNLQYLVFAKILLQRTKDLLFEINLSSIDGVRSITWWLVRALFLQQRLLDEHSSHLFDLLQVFKQETLCYLGTLEKMEEYWGADEDCSTTLSVLHLELGLLELYYGRVDASRLHYESSVEISSYNFSVSGALGFRTVHQVEPKAQLLLVSGTNDRKACAQLRHESDSTDNLPLQQSHEISEESDILLTPRFVVDERFSESEQNAQNHAISALQIKMVHQAMLMAQCSFIEKRSREWEIAPYIEAVDSQKFSPFTVQYCSNILRVRWESTRNHTKQRALETMYQLVHVMDHTSPEVAQRMYYSFGVNIPTIPRLFKEYAELLVSYGVIAEALEIYKNLELWDNVIHCNQLMGKKPEAVQLIKTRLNVKPSDPKLWCSLGDVTNDDAHYEKALEVSENKSAQALMSLARSSSYRGDYEKSIRLWESAMALNSMQPGGWFALGSAAFKSGDMDKALDAFTRDIHLDPENWLSWNNIALFICLERETRNLLLLSRKH